MWTPFVCMTWKVRIPTGTSTCPRRYRTKNLTAGMYAFTCLPAHLLCQCSLLVCLGRLTQPVAHALPFAADRAAFFCRTCTHNTDSTCDAMLRELAARMKELQPMKHDNQQTGFSRFYKYSSNEPDHQYIIRPTTASADLTLGEYVCGWTCCARTGKCKCMCMCASD